MIDSFNSNPGTSEKIKQHIDKIALCTLVVAELDYGAKASKKAKANLKKLYSFVELAKVMPFDLECVKQFGTIKKQTSANWETDREDGCFNCRNSNGI